MHSIEGVPFEVSSGNIKSGTFSLDDIIFDNFGLTQGEREAVYEAIINLIESRLEKAESLKSRTNRKRVEAAEKTLGMWAELPEEEEGQDQ